MTVVEQLRCHYCHVSIHLILQIFDSERHNQEVPVFIGGAGVMHAKCDVLNVMKDAMCVKNIE